jgi:hypothetical protein
MSQEALDALKKIMPLGINQEARKFTSWQERPEILVDFLGKNGVTVCRLLEEDETKILTDTFKTARMLESIGAKFGFAGKEPGLYMKFKPPAANELFFKAVGFKNCLGILKLDRLDGFSPEHNWLRSVQIDEEGESVTLVMGDNPLEEQGNSYYSLKYPKIYEYEEVPFGSDLG